MHLQIPHTADLAYEIVFGDLKDLFEDIISVLRENAEFEPGEGEKFETYKVEGELEDFIFDTVNDMIANIEMGWFPRNVEVDGDEIKIFFEKLKKLEKFDIKALTYHMLKIENLEDGKKRIKVVFDV